ncbi:hypothetical protein GMLC_23330 [Geomonas limicola]|uniref:Lipoprotein n=1 Tax=Geomonas limicola TaxID=2740186 RepID=A0A6V8NA43_9BACT|nr:hypothetical protein [Geomonas limicola]GFO68754.1 hypothetical protein GMLC_23330 [Geomonas limicola]
MKPSVLLVCVAVAALSFGCSATTVQTEWKDPGYHGPAASALLVACLPADSKERECEDEFVRQLSPKGIRATPAYRASAAPLGREALMAKARELGVKRVLVSRFVENKSQLDVYHRQTSMILMPDYDMWNDYQFVENQYLVFGTMLYDAETGKTIWSAVSDTYLRSSEQKSMDSYVEKMVKKLEKQGLLARP